MEILSLKKNNKILIIAAHPDDEILGCGGLISKFKKNSKIQVIFLSDGLSSRTKNKKKMKIRKSECLKLFSYLKIKMPIFFNFPDNKMDEVPLLNIVKKIEKIIKTFQPNIVFTHYEDCLNVDHRVAFKATITACRPIKKNKFINEIVSYEVPSSTEWKFSRKRVFKPNIFLDISKEIKEKKKMMKFYKSELCSYPHSRSLKGIEILSRYRGITSGLKSAEAFLLVRKKI